MEKPEIMKPGTRFTNGDMELTVLSFAENGGRNLALLIRHDDGMFITVRNLQPYNGAYCWTWGHYFDGLTEALKDYKKRFNDL